MTAERAEDTAFIEEDDDMPPLVENPYPSMTFTFAANMTPITYSTDPNTFELTPEATAPGTFMYSPPASPVLAATKPSHSKKKDASYIPRPPNAFILFRSSFIKAQHIPEKIEGNHSALSKIIGKYWKALPREEREVWEAKAIVALAEHRKKYPDWRFRPGANALAKVKDGPRRKSNKKGRGEAEKKVRNREKRCDKIADLLVAGKKGVDLEAAIQQYDSEAVKAAKVEENGCSILFVKMTEQGECPIVEESSKYARQIIAPEPAQAMTSSPEGHLRRQREEIRSCSAVVSPASRFGTPLTSMFKRSSSAPASHARTDSPGVHPDLLYTSRRHSVCSVVMSDITRETTASPTLLEHEVQARAGRGLDPPSNEAAMRNDVSRLSPLQPTLFALSGVAQHETRPIWTDTSSSGSFEPEMYSPTLPAFVPDVDDGSSPIHSPIMSAYDISVDGDYVPSPVSCNEVDMRCINSQYVQPYSSYSSLNGWAGDGLAKFPVNNYSSPYGPYVVTPQSPGIYDSEHVMRDAFEAASFVHVDALNEGLSPAGVGYSWAYSDDIQSLQHYQQGLQNMARFHGDQAQLFNHSPVPAY